MDQHARPRERLWVAGKHALCYLYRFAGWLGRIADPLSKWATISAVLVGGYWAYYQFGLSGKTDWAVNLTLETEAVPYRDGLALLVAHVKSKNPRPYELELAAPKNIFELRVRTLPTDKWAGTAIDPESDGLLVATISLLPKEGYVFPPGAEFEDVRSVVLPRGSLVSVTAELKYGGDSASVSKIVALPQANRQRTK